MEFEFKNEFTLSWVGVARMFRMAENAFIGGNVDKGQMNILSSLFYQGDKMTMNKLREITPNVVKAIEDRKAEAERNRKVITLEELGIDRDDIKRRAKELSDKMKRERG